MSTPRLFLGGAGVLRMANSKAPEAAEDFASRVRPLPLAPAGIGGECTFTGVYITVTHTAGGKLKVTPVIDGKPVPASALILELEQLADPETTTDEIPVFEPQIVAGKEYSRQNIVGQFFTVIVETVGALTPGELSFGGLEVEFSIKRRGKEAAK